MIVAYRAAIPRGQPLRIHAYGRQREVIAAPRRLVIATRESALALWQAKHIQTLLVARYPSSEVRLLGLTTEGDRVQDQPLADVSRRSRAETLRKSRANVP